MRDLEKAIFLYRQHVDILLMTCGKVISFPQETHSFLCYIAVTFLIHTTSEVMHNVVNTS